MAGASSERFPNVETYTIQELQNNAKNKNTSTSTKFWIIVFKSWAKQKRFPEEIETYEPSELDTALQQFYAEVRNKDGEDYEPDSLRVMIAALDRHLKEHGYKQSIIRDREFFTSKQVLEGKARRLREEGKGKRQNKARSLSKEEEEVLWVAGKLGNNSPESLVNTIWWILTQYFGLRGRQKHHSMKVDDFALRKDDDGQEYVEFAEGLTKTRGGGLSKKSRDFSPKMFATGERCPVSLFKEYLSRRPQQMKTTGPFYLSVNYNAKDEIWYKAQPMGINRIKEMMKRIVAGSSLEASCKKLTNHSARKTLVNKLKKTNVERSSIVKVTGHRNLQSLDDYDEGDEAEQRDLSTKISRRNNLQISNPSFNIDDKRSGSTTTNMAFDKPCFSQSLVRHESKHQMFDNSFHNCNVTFNVIPPSRSDPDVQISEPKRRRTLMFESDSN